MQKHGAERVVYQCGDLRVDLANRRLTKGDRECPLEPKAFAVLAVLLDRADELVTRDELLDAVWGHRYVTPATLNRAMTLLRRAFNDDADCPRAIRTVHGAGYRFIGSVRRIEPLRPAAPTPVIVPLPYRLPAKLERLVGREDELRRLGEMLIQHRAVSLVGAGGMGKTQCALEASRLASESYADGVWFFDLSPLERAQEWATALATALSTPVDASGDPAEVLSRTAATLADRQVLFVLDNCDRLVVELGPIVLALLRACPSLRLLATSRQRLDFLGERLMWLSPLTLPPPADEARRAPLEDIAGIAAVELLLTRVAEVQPSLALTSDNVAEIVEICRRLDGMPLALELAAAQFAMLPPAAVHARLRLHLGSLASGSAGREARHQTLQALVDWSYDLLSPQEQRLFCWLGVFHGWTLDAAEWIGHALGIEAGALVEQHSGMILKSLVVANPTLLPPRFRMLETVREFALQALRVRGEEKAASARHKHLAYFVQVAERSHDGIRAGEARHWVERLRHEHANVEGSIQWALFTTDEPGAAIKLAGALMLYGKCHGVWTLTAS